MIFPMPTLQEAWLAAGRRLAAHSETPGLDAQVLLARLLQVSRAWLLARPEQPLPPETGAALEAALLRLEAGEPLPYLLGRWEFYGLEFAVGPAALIPRPETELLVEHALGWLRAHPAARLAADVGTGTGCIAVSLAAQVADLRFAALDLSAAALALAADNARRHGVERRVWLVQADLLPRLARRFDLVCANLPYIPTGELAGLRVADFEPTLALDGGPDGLAVIRRLVGRLPAALAAGGRALLEIGAGQGAAALALARLSLPGARAAVLPDLAGRDRLLVLDWEASGNPG
jgi:release factor glutamine methyltransferase